MLKNEMKLNQTDFAVDLYNRVSFNHALLYKES